MEAVLLGHVARKRPLSKRLLFVELQTAPIVGTSEGAAHSITKVVVKDECSGVGGAADARYALKLGDIVRVHGINEAPGTVLAIAGNKCDLGDAARQVEDKNFGCIGFLIMRSERHSDFGKHERTDLVES